MKFILTGHVMIRYLWLILFFNFQVIAGQITSCNWSSMMVTMPAFNVVLQKNAVIGQKIGSVVNGAAVNATCSYTGAQANQRLLIRTALVDSGVKDGEIKIWKTNIPGIGVAIGFKGVTNDSYQTSWDNWIGLSGHTASGDHWMTSPGNITSPFSWKNITPEYQLYKIEENAESGILSGTFASFSATSDDIPNDGSGLASPNINFGGGAITVLKCDVINNSLYMEMGDIPVSEFVNGVGSVSRTSSAKNIEMDCDKDANVKMTLEGTIDKTSSLPSVIQLTSNNGSEAEGIGVQVIYNNIPLEIGKTIQVLTSSGGVENISLAARYIQTAAIIKAGKANAIATLNIIYQ